VNAVVVVVVVVGDVACSLTTERISFDAPTPTIVKNSTDSTAMMAA
jgi:hypothetical protein